MASYASFSKGPLPPRATMIKSLAGVKRALQPGAYKRDPNGTVRLVSREGEVGQDRRS
jgi:hypothetical protein